MSTPAFLPFTKFHFSPARANLVTRPRLVTLASRDGTFHITEKMYIKQVGKLLGFSDADIEETIATTG